MMISSKKERGFGPQGRAWFKKLTQAQAHYVEQHQDQIKSEAQGADSLIPIEFPDFEFDEALAQSTPQH